MLYTQSKLEKQNMTTACCGTEKNYFKEDYQQWAKSPLIPNIAEECTATAQREALSNLMSKVASIALPQRYVYALAFYIEAVKQSDPIGWQKSVEALGEEFEKKGSDIEKCQYLRENVNTIYSSILLIQSLLANRNKDSEEVWFRNALIETSTEYVNLMALYENQSQKACPSLVLDEVFTPNWYLQHQAN